MHQQSTARVEPVLSQKFSAVCRIHALLFLKKATSIYQCVFVTAQGFRFIH
jgi:hypothetical protein